MGAIFNIRTYSELAYQNEIKLSPAMFFRAGDVKL